MRLRPASHEALLTYALVLVSIVWGGFLGARQIAGLASGLDHLEYLTLDWRFLLAGARPAPRGVVIAAIDDETLRELGSFPLPRDILAQIVRELAASEPQAIAIDMLFLEPGKQDSDDALAAALRSARSAVGAVGVFGSDISGTREPTNLDDPDLVPAPSNVLWPIEAIRQSSRTGLVNLSTDYAGVPRFIPMVFRVGESLAPSLALAASSAALSAEPVLGNETLKLAARTVNLDLGYHLPIRYYGPRGAVRQFSIAQMLRGGLNPDLVRGQVVIIGATAVGVGDMFAIPYDRVVPGVEVIATAISNLLAGDGLIRSRLVRKMDAVVAVVLPIILVLLLAVRRSAVGVMLASVVVVLWLAAVYAAFQSNVWLSIAVPLASALPVVGTYGLGRLITDRALSQRLTSERLSLAKFQSPLLVEHISANPRFLEKPVQQNISVVFLDLSGFTGVAESLGPEWARDLLAEFHTRVERDVVLHGGYVVSFMGDGAMIVFGVPSPKSDDGLRALRAIMQLHVSIDNWIDSLPPVARDRLKIRIGGHYGPVVLSRLGAAEHQYIAATGDTVNVTSRLLEIAKQRSATIIVTDDLWSNAPYLEGSIGISSPIDVDIRGRTRGLRIRILFDPKNPTRESL